MARWADAADDTEALGGRARAVLGAGPRGPVAVDLHVEGPHLLIEGPPGSGRTELLRSVAASLAAAERPDRLGIVLMEGRDGTGGHGTAAAGEGLQVCTDLPHVTTHLTTNDPVRMREFAQSLSAELKRRSELLGRLGFGEWHTGQAVSGRLVAQRAPGPSAGTRPSTGAADLDTPSSSTLRLRPAAARRQTEPGPPLARLVVVVGDLDALLSPPLGSPGRPAAGSVVRALEAVAREGDRLGVHLVAASAVDGRTAGSELARSAALRVALDAPSPGPDEPSPGGAVCCAGTGGKRPSRAAGSPDASPARRHCAPRSSPWSGIGWATRRPAAPSASWGTARRTWPCSPARWSARHVPSPPPRCRRCCSGSEGSVRPRADPERRFRSGEPASSALFARSVRVARRGARRHDPITIAHLTVPALLPPSSDQA